MSLVREDQVIEQAALECFKELGYVRVFSPDITPADFYDSWAMEAFT